eukprot:TRINITY_DN2525_c0_g2_i1.p1 TRINITY_DN2525_c0_g2~~TRINITY_DN2525_c0_g2_i1.p1  ORF type:complete len:258 (+),score=70.90 TRINITY_DN2525_c0_g2_i1:65-838(+)
MCIRDRYLNFRSAFAVHALGNAAERNFSLSVLREFADSAHGFISNCTRGVLTYADYRSVNAECAKKEKALAEASKDIHSKLFLKTFEDDFMELEQRLDDLFAVCLPQNSKAIREEVGRDIHCSLKLRGIITEIADSFKVDVINPKVIGCTLGVYKRQLLQNAERGTHDYLMRCVKSRGSSKPNGNDPKFYSCKRTIKEASLVLNQAKKILDAELRGAKMTWTSPKPLTEAYGQIIRQCHKQREGKYISNLPSTSIPK